MLSLAQRDLIDLIPMVFLNPLYYTEGELGLRKRDTVHAVPICFLHFERRTIILEGK